MIGFATTEEVYFTLKSNNVNYNEIINKSGIVCLTGVDQQFPLHCLRILGTIL
ncbi:hypothetical protein [Mechercharimyces sp. CAU 1602]|uniref:hypothetical protein n=1 Tax=Mechercharimyces sp. CAU 1602 TaxID=2973933 RepID=UPI0021630CFA|nr:hypothetical protein [Mechercharimyces sp. CAU 1602]MCS1350418.1 hypothetical protein [Mechercharimyces sp. CAU 1602]